MNGQGRPSGEAVVQFGCAQAAQRALKKVTRRCERRRGAAPLLAPARRLERALVDTRRRRAQSQL